MRTRVARFAERSTLQHHNYHMNPGIISFVESNLTWQYYICTFLVKQIHTASIIRSRT